MAASASSHAGSLPLSRSRLIGREAERALARSFLLDEAVPLLTLTGPGGAGKTRLALAIAAELSDRFEDGFAWVDLAPMIDPSRVAATVARALQIVPAPDVPLQDHLSAQLRSRQLLLLVDNCEHVLAEAAALLAGLLAACPALQILATSRAPLRIRGEQELLVDPLPVPPDTAGIAEIAVNDAVRLFAERVRAVLPAFGLDEGNAGVVAEICRRLDGLPLAIELAAPHVRALPLATLNERLHHRLPMLADGPRDAPARQRTIRDTIAWSYGLLAPADKAAFSRLAVFVGGFTLEAARAIASDDDAFSLLERLVEHHLIRPVPGHDEPRYAMLETIREFGLERLEEKGEEPAMRRRHAAYFRELAHRLDAWVAPYMPNSRQILDRLEDEYPNLHAALTWLRDTGDVSGLLELAGALDFFWQMRWRLREGRAWLEWGLSQDANVTAAARARGALALSSILFVQNEDDAAWPLCEESLCSSRMRGDLAGVARASDHAACMARSPAQLDTYVEESLAAMAGLSKAPWHRRLTTHLLMYQGKMNFWHGNLSRSEEILNDVCQQNAALARETGAEHAFACWPLLELGVLASLLGDAARATERYQAALRLAWHFRELRCIAFSVTSVAGTLARAGCWEEASCLFGAVEALCERAAADFSEMWTDQRVLGLPEPWQQGNGGMPGSPVEEIAASVRHARSLPRIPDVARADELWEAGRRMGIEDAVEQALAVDLATPAGIVERNFASETTPMTPLSPRERDVLILVCERLTDPQIAERLYLSTRTVESHVSSILGKLGVENRRDAAAMAVRLRLV